MKAASAWTRLPFFGFKDGATFGFSRGLWVSSCLSHLGHTVSFVLSSNLVPLNPVI